MRVLDEAALLARLARWAIATARHDTRDATLVPGNPRFTSAREAVSRIPDGAVVAVSGFGGMHRASIVHWALRERFEATGHPRDLTLINVGGHGGRGQLPGTLEELARPGLVTRLFTSHFETLPGFLALAAARRCELQCLPLGVIAELYDALGRGADSVLSDVGVGTFLDPRGGRGSPVQGGRRPQWIAAEGDQLRYRIPPIDVAIFNLPAADSTGNLYTRGAALIGDSREIARAARRNGGLVIANVGLLVDAVAPHVFLPADAVDAIVCHDDTEQMAGYFHREPWSLLVPDGAGTIAEGLEQARVVRRLGELAGGFPRRTPVDEVLTRVAAATLADALAPDAHVAIGTGLPETIAPELYASGRGRDFTFLVESGAVGGVPAQGVYFGASFCPSEIVSTAELFARCRHRLDAVCLGALEIDAAGDVNVSRRGRGVRSYIGPGGFIDFATRARTIVFVSHWMRGGEMHVADGEMRIGAQGRPKFVARLAERCFDAARALRAGKCVFYVTPVGVFRRGEGGLELASVMPGIDVERDILARTPFPIALPGSGPVPLVDRAAFAD